MNNQTSPTAKTIKPIPGSPLPGNIRRSKIGRLPTELRHWLNQSLRDGVPYESICQQLTKMGYPGITPSNLSIWSNGGHLHWVRDQDAADQLRDQANRLTDVLAEMDDDTADKCAKLAEQMAAIQIAQMLQSVDPTSGKPLVQDDPELFFRLVRTLTHQKREQTFSKKAELEQRKYNDQVAEALRVERQAQRDRDEKGGYRFPTDEEITMLHGARGYYELPPEELPKIVNKYRLLMYRINREAEERVRCNYWENIEVSPDPYVAAIERGEDPFAPRQLEQAKPAPDTEPQPAPINASTSVDQPQADEHSAQKLSSPERGLQSASP